MKILKHTLILVLMILTTIGCSSDDDSDNGNNGSDQVSEDNLSKIQGTWFFVLRTTNTEADDLEECEQLNNLVFTSSQVSIQEVFGVTCNETQSTSEEYSINGNTLNVVGFIVEIVHLDNVALIVTYTEDGDAIVETYAKQ